MSYRPKIKNNASGALTDLALDAETINGITSADIVTKTELNSGLTTGGNIIFNDRLIVNATSDLVGDLYIGQWNHSGGSVTPGVTQASLRVNGTLTTTGEINTNGHSISVGAINCDEIEAGSSTVYCGNIFCGEINGSTAYLGNTSLSSLSVNGTTSLSGNITCNGTFNGNDASYSGSVTVSGTLRANNDLKTQSVYPSTTNSKSLGKSNYLYKYSYITEMHTDKITSLTNTETYIDPTTGEPATRNVFVTMPLASGTILTDTNIGTTAGTVAAGDHNHDNTYIKYTSLSNYNSAGTTKTVAKTTPTAIYVPNGLIMGGTAGDAGLITRGICGCSVPTDSAATKDMLFLNYDRDNTYRSNRQIIIQAGEAGTHYGNNIYQYAAVRGDAFKSYSDANYLGISATAADSSKLNGQAASYYLNYNNLSNKPTIPATNVIPATTTANKLLVSTTTSGTSKWSDFSSAGFLKTNASGVISVDTNSYLTTSGTAANSSKLGNVAASNYIQKSNTAGLVKNDGTIDTTAYSTFTGYTSTNKLSTNYINNVAGWTSNAGTVTSVRVQAGTGLSSSTSTAQTSTLNTTISIASGYKLPTTTEWAGKQNTLSSTNKLSSSYISWDGDIDLSNNPEGHHLLNVGGYDSSNLDFSIDNDGWMYYTGGNPMSIQETHDSKTIRLSTDYEEVRTKNTTYTLKEDGLYLDSTKVTFALGTTATTACAGNDSRLSDSRTPKSHTHGNITNTGTITSTAVTSATGVLVYDSSNKIQRATAANVRSIIGAQATLVSGTNIKTINNQSLLGSGNINISGGGSNYTHHAMLWYGTISGTYFSARLNIWTEDRSTKWTNTNADKDDLMEQLAEWINSCQVIAQGIVTISSVAYPIVSYSAGEYEDDDGNVYFTLDFLYMYSGQYRSVRLDTGVNTMYTATTIVDTIID